MHEATAQLDALLALEAADSEDGMPPHAGADAPAAAVTARRLVCLLSQCAPRLFPAVRVSALARHLSRAARQSTRRAPPLTPLGAGAS